MTDIEDEDLPTEPTFDSAYAAERGTLYRSLVLITGNRDISLEAVDRGFAHWQSRRASRRGDARFDVFSTAYRWAARKLKKPSRMIQGFRFQEDDGDETDAALLEHFDSLDMIDRGLLTCVHYLGWSTDRAAAATGLPVGEALPRVRAAQSRLARSAGVDAEAAGGKLGPALTDRAGHLPEPLERTDQVRTRATVRRIVFVAAGTIGGAALIAGLGFGIQRIIADTSERQSAASGTSSGTSSGPDAASDAGIFTAETLVWERVPSPVQEGELNSVAYGPAGFVAVGQEWSGNGRSLTLVSEDGVYWEAGPGPADGPNSWVHQMTLADDTYIAVGSAFNENNGSDSPFIAMSGDGITWTTIELPIRRQTEINGRQMNLHTWIQSVAVAGDRTVVLATQNVDFDAQFLIEEAAGDDIASTGNWGWSDRGIEIYSPQGDVERVVTWEEVGVDAETVTLLTSGRPLLFTSTDLTTWEESTLEGFGPNRWVSAVVTTGDVFAALVVGDFGQTLWVSEDGAAWTEQTVFEDGTSISSLATVGDRVIAVGSAADGESLVWLTSDLEQWEAVEIPFGKGWLQNVHVSNAGIVVIGEENSNGRPTGQVEIMDGDLTVLAFDSGGFTVVDADGVELAKIPNRDAQLGDDGIVELVDPDTGETLVAFAQRELDQAWQEHWQQFEQQREASGPSLVLLISEDGENWQRHALVDSVGGGFYPNSVAIGPDSVVMTGWQEEGIVNGLFGGGPGVTIWVGTAP